MTAREDRRAHQDEAVSRQYDGWARVYDWVWHRYMNRTLPMLEQAANVAGDEHVLDVACGTGVLLQRILETEPTAQVAGIDISPQMVDKARTKLPPYARTSVQTADAHNIPFPADTFDVVVSASTFHYFTAPQGVLKEMARVLSPEGRLVLLDWCRDYWACRLMNTWLRWTDPAHHQCYTLGELAGMVERSPLEFRIGGRYRFDLVWGMMIVEAAL